MSTDLFKKKEGKTAIEISDLLILALGLRINNFTEKRHITFKRLYAYKSLVNWGSVGGNIEFTESSNSHHFMTNRIDSIFELQDILF